MLSSARTSHRHSLLIRSNESDSTKKKKKTGTGLSTTRRISNNLPTTPETLPVTPQSISPPQSNERRRGRHQTGVLPSNDRQSIRVGDALDKNGIVEYLPEVMIVERTPNTVEHDNSDDDDDDDDKESECSIEMQNASHLSIASSSSDGTESDSCDESETSSFVAVPLVRPLPRRFLPTSAKDGKPLQQFINLPCNSTQFNSRHPQIHDTDEYYPPAVALPLSPEQQNYLECGSPQRTSSFRKVKIHPAPYQSHLNNNDTSVPMDLSLKRHNIHNTTEDNFYKKSNSDNTAPSSFVVVVLDDKISSSFKDYPSKQTSKARRRLDSSSTSSSSIPMIWSPSCRFEPIHTSSSSLDSDSSKDTHDASKMVWTNTSWDAADEHANFRNAKAFLHYGRKEVEYSKRMEYLQANKMRSHVTKKGWREVSTEKHTEKKRRGEGEEEWSLFDLPLLIGWCVCDWAQLPSKPVCDEFNFSRA